MTGVEYNQDRVNQVIAGSSGSDSAGSWGDRMWQAIKARAVGNLEWAITDRRLLLIAAGPRYIQIATAVTEIAEGQLSDRDKLAPVWSGDAYNAFSETVDLIDYQLLPAHRSPR